MTDFFHVRHAWIGNRVCVKNINQGTLRYFGEISAQDGKWCGIELDESLGENDGAISGERYFSCRANHGIFVPAADVTRMQCRNDGSFSNDFKQNPALISIENQETEFQGDYHLAIVADSIKNETFLNKDGGNCVKTDLNQIYPDKTVNFSTTRSNELFKNSSKDSISDHMDSEESLGIIPDILDSNSSCDFLSLNSNDFLPMEQSPNLDKSCSVFQFPEKDVFPDVFSPSNSKYCHLFSQAKCVDSPLQNRLEVAKYTSTPKQIIKNPFNLNTTITLQQNPYSDFLLQDAKLEPVIAGSDLTTNAEIDFCNGDFESERMLCSTSKISSLLLSDTIVSAENIDLTNNDLSLTPINTNTFIQDNLNKTKILLNEQMKTKTKLNYHKENALHHVEALNATYEVKPFSYDDEGTSFRNNFRSDFGSASNINVLNKDIVRNLDFVSEMGDITIQNLSAEKTFIIDGSPVDNALVRKSNNMSETSSLNITVEEKIENNIGQSIQVNSAIYQINEIASNLSKTSITSNKAGQRKSISLPVSSSDSLKGSIIKNRALDKTFCLGNADKKSKRHSTSTYISQSSHQSVFSNTKSDGTEKLNVFKKPLPVRAKFKKPELKEDPCSAFKAIDKNPQKPMSYIKKLPRSPINLIPKNAVTRIIPERKIPVPAPSKNFPKTVSKTKSKTLLPQMNKSKIDGKSKLSSTCRSSNDDCVKVGILQLKHGEKEANLTKVNKLNKDSVIQVNVLKKSPQTNVLDEDVSKHKTQDEKENDAVQKYSLPKFPIKIIKAQAIIKKQESEIPLCSGEFPLNAVVNVVEEVNEISKTFNELHGKEQIEKNAECSTHNEFNLVQNNKSNSVINKPSKSIPKISSFNSIKRKADTECSAKGIVSNTVKNKMRHSLLPSLKSLGSKNGISTSNKIPSLHKNMYAADKQVENAFQELNITDDEYIPKNSQQSQFQNVSISEERKEKGFHKVLLLKENVGQEVLASTEVADLNKKLSDTFSANRVLMPIAGNAENGSKVPVLKSVPDKVAFQSNHGSDHSSTKTSLRKLPSRKLPSPRLYPRRSHLPTPSYLKK